MAPEAMLKNARIDASVDCFSFGVLMWEIVCGRGSRPYPNMHPADIPRAVRGGMRPIFQQGVPSAYRRLAQACWDADPLRRPSAAALVVAVKAQLSQYTAEVAAQRHMAAAAQAAAAQAAAAVAASAQAAATQAAAAQAVVMAAAAAALGGRGRAVAATAATPATMTNLEAQLASTPEAAGAGEEVGQW
ncbi:Mast/stem cell growth factor receptor Kit [Tetrabaena socialis]|uniref:Mast/stem cell growth factor receptor Kit n=1 Tax=Tetrabaena socialis TaxID=47790 RepID=A0A2J7ZUB5_9CHLO|nr:Mast/stem cell growth factor receptor Kit [Tetrabaena socialis]|eukprot:PNH03838.1 Mast/stem cell growth factor receptor Kit [Tetrabaena socialis]